MEMAVLIVICFVILGWILTTTPKTNNKVYSRRSQDFVYKSTAKPTLKSTTKPASKSSPNVDDIYDGSSSYDSGSSSYDGGSSSYDSGSSSCDSGGGGCD